MFPRLNIGVTMDGLELIKSALSKWVSFKLVKVLIVSKLWVKIIKWMSTEIWSVLIITMGIITITIKIIIMAINNSIQLHLDHMLDSGKCTIGGQNEDSGKFRVRTRAARHRWPPMVDFPEFKYRYIKISSRRLLSTLLQFVRFLLCQKQFSKPHLPYQFENDY